MKNIFHTALVGIVLGVATGCTNESNAVPTQTTGNVYIQVDRLGRPGIKEIFEPFADHDSSDRATPTNDGVLRAALTNFPAAYGGTTGSATPSTLWPDVLKINLAGSTAGYLGVELGTSDFGGRAVADDVMTTDLNIAYGTGLGGTPPVPAKPCLLTDNVGPPAATTNLKSSFPYLQDPR